MVTDLAFELKQAVTMANFVDDKGLIMTGSNVAPYAQKVNDQLNDAVIMVRRQTEELRDFISKFRDKMVALQTANFDLKAERDALKSTIASLEDQLKASDARFNTLSARYTSLISKIEAGPDERFSLESRIENIALYSEMSLADQGTHLSSPKRVDDVMNAVFSENTIAEKELISAA